MNRTRAITEAQVRAAAGGARTLVLPKGAVVTPAARDLAKQLGVALVGEARSREQGAVPSVRTTGTPPSSLLPEGGRGPIVAIGSDHGGFPMKEALKQVLAELDCRVLDVGTHSTDAVDYPDFAVAVARAVADGTAWRGIMVDGAGIGSCMAANKIPGVRAAMCYDLTTAANARAHNNANVLTLGGTLLGPRLAEEIVKAFLITEFAGGRHEPRVAKIDQLDRR